MGAELSRLLARERLPHAILIESAAEDTAADFARQVAIALLCRREEKPCGECSACKKVRSDIHPDFLSYEGEGKSRAISVDKVREIRSGAYVLPNESERKIILLRGADAMLPPAQNALLKILEEPPASAVFILTAVNRFKMLETVRSRVSVISLESGPETAESPKHGEIVLRLINHINNGKEAQALALFAEYEKERAEFLELLDELRAHLLSSMLEGGARRAAELWAYADAIDQTKRAAQSNVGTALLGCSLCAALFEADK